MPRWPGRPVPVRGGTPSTGDPTSWPSHCRKLDALLADQGRTRSDLTITVCPYMQPLDADVAERYAEAGVDAVAALLFAFGAEDVRPTLDRLQPVFDRAGST